MATIADGGRGWLATMAGGGQGWLVMAGDGIRERLHWAEALAAGMLQRLLRLKQPVRSRWRRLTRLAVFLTGRCALHVVHPVHPMHPAIFVCADRFGSGWRGGGSHFERGGSAMAAESGVEQIEELLRLPEPLPGVRG